MPSVTKRSRALAPVKPSGFSEDAAGREEEAFAARVAVHLREFASKRRRRLGGDEAAVADGWTAETADAAVRAAAAMLPRDSHVRARIEACLDAFTAKVVGVLTAVEKETELAISEEDSRAYASLDASALEAASIAPDDDFEAMSLARCVRETHRRLLVASFDAPLVLADDVRESASREEARRARDAVAKARAASAEAAAAAAEATARRYVEDVARAKARARDKKARREARDAFVRSEEAKQAERVVARAFALVALRRGELASDTARAAAARAVLARHALRAAAGFREHQTAAGRRVGVDSLSLPFADCLDTPGRDAALACGNDRVHLIRELARRVPDDVAADATSPAGGGDEKERKKRKRRNVVGAFGVGDLPLFQAALGIGGFDERFEAQAVAGSISTFAALTGVVPLAAADGDASWHTDGQSKHGRTGVGPALLPRRARGAEEASRAASAAAALAAASAFRPDASLRDVVRSYERALAGDPFAEDEPEPEEASSQEAQREADLERAHLEAYFDCIKIVRACGALCVAGGDRRAAEDHARFAGRAAAAPSSLLAHLPAASVATACAHATSVELAACGAAAWREVVRAKDAALAALGGDADAEDAFFVDRGGDGDDGGDGDGGDGAARAAALAETLAEGDAGAALQGETLTVDEEDELAAMLRSHRAGLDEEAGEDPMGNLESEEETKRALGL